MINAFLQSNGLSYENLWAFYFTKENEQISLKMMRSRYINGMFADTPPPKSTKQIFYNLIRDRDWRLFVIKLVTMHW